MFISADVVLFNNIATNMHSNLDSHSMEINGNEGVIYADGWVDAPPGRGTVKSIWSCFFTITVACWTVPHLNLPSPGEV